MKRIAVLTGGNSSERGIALQSAKTVFEALKPHASVDVFDFPEQLEAFIGQRKEFDSCVPVFHGKGGEDGTIQGFLETLGVPYLFSGVVAHAIGMNKVLTKELARRAGIQTPKYQVIGGGEQCHLDCPVVVKPIESGSSVGVRIVKEKEMLKDAIDLAMREGGEVMLEEFVGGEEFTVAVIDELDDAVALPVIQIKSKNEFFDLESKYDPELCDELCPAPIDDELARRLQTIAMCAHKLIGARHVTRSDFIVDSNGEIWFLEINTIPGMTKHSLLPRAIRESGRDFGELLMGWIEQ